MNNIKRILIILFIGLFLALSLIQPLRAYEDFYFENYTIELDVKENGEIHVQETFDTRFTDYLHGIYMNLPTTYEMEWEDGNVKEYYFPISNIKIHSNHNYEISYFNDGVQIRLGDSDKYANREETYSISYVIHTKDLDLNGRQMLFYNLISRNWDTYFNHMYFTIHLPEAIDAGTILFDTPYGLIQQSNEDLSYTYRGNTIQGTYNHQLQENQPITLWIELPENYFTFPDYSIINYVSLGIGGVLTLFILFVFIKKGKDEPVIPTVEFKAPEGLNSAEVGYIIDGVCDPIDVTSLILYWAQQGYLTIEEKGEEDLIFHKVQDLPPTAQTYEQTMFQKLFAKGDDVHTQELKGQFSDTIQGTAHKVNQRFNKKETRIYQSKGLQIVTCLITGTPLAIATAMQTYFSTFVMPLVFLDAILYLLIIAGISAILIYTFNRWYSLTSVRRVMLCIASFFVFLLVFGVSYLIFHIQIPFILLLIYTFLSILLMLLSANMRQRTTYGNTMLGKVIGLRDFILTAEKDRLDMLVKENPAIFYDILPYAYAFGITDIWSEHFKDMQLEPCDWYTCYNTGNFYYMTNRLNHSMNNFHHTATYVEPSKSSGGISGGSGGGFSGGGFGGSGGGGW